MTVSDNAGDNANAYIYQLCVSDIERLAKAGVQIGLTRIVPVSDPYPAAAHEAPHTAPPMAEAIWERWRRSKRVSRPPAYGDYLIPPFELLASQHGDKVWVSVHPTNYNYDPFQIQDDSAIFPSDGLMASLALWERHHP